MRKQHAAHVFLIATADPNPANTSELTDEDLRSAFEQIPFDLDSLEDEDA